MNHKTASLSRSIVLMLLASLAFAAMGLLVRLAEETDVMWKVLFRNLVVLLVLLATTKPSQWFSLLGRRENRGLLTLRGLAGTLGILGYFVALTYLPLADASLLNRLNPFFVALLGVPLLGQRLKAHQIIALVLAFVGAWMVINPSGNVLLWPTLAGLGSAAAAGFAYVMIRKIGSRESTSTIMAYFAFFSLLSTLPVILVSGAHLAIDELGLLLAAGACAALGQTFLTYSFKSGHAATVSVFGYSNVVFAGIMGLIAFGERGQPLFYGGAGVILLSLLLLYWMRDR